MKWSNLSNVGGWVIAALGVLLILLIVLVPAMLVFGYIEYIEQLNLQAPVALILQIVVIIVSFCLLFKLCSYISKKLN